MKKMIKLNQKETAEFSFEEIVEKYQNYLNNTVWGYFSTLKKLEQHTSHLDKEDLYQQALIALYKAYNNYDYDYKHNNPNDNYDETDKMGFYPYMDKMVKGEMSRLYRDELKLRRKDYNIHEINLNSFDTPICKNSDDKDMFLSDIIADEDDNYASLLDSMEVFKLFKFLSIEEKEIMHDRYFNDLTQLELARKYKVSQAQISRTIRKSIKKIQSGEIKEKEDMAKRSKVDYSEVKKMLYDNARDTISYHDLISDVAKRFKIKDTTMVSNLYRLYGADVISEIKNKCKADASRMVNRINPQDLLQSDNEVMPSIAPIETPKYPNNIDLSNTIIKQDPVNNALNGLRIKSLEVEFDSFIGDFKEDTMVMDLYCYDEEDLNRLTIEDLEKFKSDIDKAINLLKMFNQ